MRPKTLIVLCLLILFSFTVSFSQKKSSQKPKKTKRSKTNSSTRKIETVFLDTQNKKIGSKEFADFIVSGDFGFENLDKDFSALKLKPISDVKLQDEIGQTLSSQEFKEKITNSGVGFEPVIEKGKVVGLKIRKYFLYGEPAPEFSIKTLDGNFIKSIEQNGKILVVNFWFIGCLPCMEEIPALNKIVEKFGSNSEVVFLGIATDSEESLKAFLTKRQFDFRIATAQKTDILEKYKPNRFGFPITIIIDQKGKIVFGLNALGSDAKLLESAIQRLLR